VGLTVTTLSFFVSLFTILGSVLKLLGSLSQVSELLLIPFKVREAWACSFMWFSCVSGWDTLAWARKTVPTTAHTRKHSTKHQQKNHVFTTLTQSAISIQLAYDPDLCVQTVAQATGFLFERDVISPRREWTRLSENPQGSLYKSSSSRLGEEELAWARGPLAWVRPSSLSETGATWC